MSQHKEPRDDHRPNGGAMTTEKWQLYSQTGVDGPEYGVRIRTGYTVVGFQKEDAQAIVDWQNASIQPEGNIMEKAKALRNAALPRQTYSIPGQTGYGNPSLSKGWDFSAVDELVRVVVLELIAEVGRLQDKHARVIKRVRAYIIKDAIAVCDAFDWRDDEITRLRNESDTWKAKAIEERFQLLCCSEYEPPRTEASLRAQAARELEEEMQCKREE